MKRYIRLIVIIITVIVAAIFYQSQYSVDTTNLESKIENYIKKENIILHTYKELEIDDYVYLFANYEFENKNGIVVLVKGINNKYRLNTAFFSDENIDFVNISISKIYHILIYGRTEKVVSKLDIHGRTVTYFSEDVNDTNILIVKDTLLRTNEINSCEIKYLNGESEIIKLDGNSMNGVEYKDFVYSGNQGQAKLGVILILFSGYLISFIFKPNNKYKGFEGSGGLPEKHRIN